MANIEELTKNFDVISFLKHFNISFSYTGNMVTKNYIGIEHCPFCDKHKTHSGIHKERHNFYCWVCGGHTLFNYIKKVLNIENYLVFRYLKQFSSKNIDYKTNPSVSNWNLFNNECTLPKGTHSLENRFKQYIKNRGYPLSIVKKYNLKNTGIEGDFKHRLIFPFYINNQLVTYIGRSISKKSYKDCPIEKSILPPKLTLYNYDKLKSYDNCLIVEGVFDCLRIGDNCVSTSGVSWSDNQIKLLLNKHPKKVYVCYDSEIEAQEKAKKLCGSLSLYTETERIELPKGDIGDLTSEEGYWLRNKLNLKGDQY